MSIFEELKRRNVIRAGIAYVIVAWLVMQFADVVLNNIEAPHWVFQVIMLVLGIGLPVVLVFAWAFEMTPEGIKKEKDIDRSQSITNVTGQKLNYTIIGLLVLALGYFVWEAKFQNASREIPASAETPPPVRDKSVAVLPFANRSTNPEDEFFAEGMHDDLLTQLAKIGAMKVISRTSVMEYKNTTKKLPEIAKELGVATIVEGGVQRSGSRIRFNAQLIDAKTDEHLWAETYNRELTAENLFDIQAEIARSIAGALQATLSPAEEASIDRPLTGNLEAWEAYRRAVRLRQSISTQTMKTGLSEVNHALELDPDFAAAWSLKAILLLQQYWFYDTDIATRDAAWDAIQRGRAIDPTLAELDLAEGYYYYWGFRDYEKALPFMQKASAALPNNSRVHLARAYVLRRMGRWESVLAALHRASELDPREATTFSDIGETLGHLRRFEDARQALTRARDMAPGNPNIIWARARLELQESGNVSSFARLNHLAPAPHPDAQTDRWRSSLYIDDFDTAQQDVVDWLESFLVSKDFRVTRPMLSGLTYRYAGNTVLARPLLLEARQEFETLLGGNPDDFPILRSLCFIAGALDELKNARQYCENSLQAAPKDAFLSGEFKLDAAAGLALAGDAQAAVKLMRAMLEGDVSPAMYEVMYHPAFDGIRDNPAYVELLNEYGPKTNE